MSRFVVAGAPCAGKSSYVRAHAQRGDLIYDYDTLHQALSGLSLHEHLAELRPYVMAARDALLAELAARKQQPAWVISSARSAAELKALAERLNAELIVLEVSRDEAHRRCREAGRPEAWHGYIDAWFDEGDVAQLVTEEKSMKTKTFTAPIELKADGEGEPGEFTAVFSRFNVVDHDGDVTLPGAFRDGQEVLIEGWNHNYSAPPVGKGVIHQDDEKAWVDGRFFLDTAAGKEHYLVAKNLGDLQEWSYTFLVEDGRVGQFEGKEVFFLEKLDVWGVGQVTRGAGIGTRTTMIKNRDGDDPEPVEPEQNEDEAGDVGKSSEAALVGFGIQIDDLSDGEIVISAMEELING